MKRLIPFLMAAMLVGCGGRDFVRPQSTDLRVGVTRYEDVVRVFGAPASTSSSSLHGTPVTITSYLHGAVGPLGTSMSIKQMACVFRDGVLVSYDFASSFDAERLRVYEAKVRSLAKGQTRADVEGVLGSPTGEAIFPVIPVQGNTQLRYTDLRTDKIPFVPRPKETRRVATILLDATGMVVESSVVETKTE